MCEVVTREVEPDRVLGGALRAVCERLGASSASVYLLDAEPGRYVVVASYTVSRMDQQGVYRSSSDYFSEELVGLTEINVRPASLNFMGKFMVDTSPSGDFDQTQRHYYSRLDLNSGKSDIEEFFSGHVAFRGTLYQDRTDDESRQKFLEFTREKFESTGWGEVIPELRVTSSSGQ